MRRFPAILSVALFGVLPGIATAQGTAELRVLGRDGSDWTSPPLRVGLELFNFAAEGPCAEPFEGIVSAWTDDTFAGPNGAQVRFVVSATVDHTGLRLSDVTLDGEAESLAYWPAPSQALGAAEITRQGRFWTIKANFIQSTHDAEVISLQIAGRAPALDERTGLGLAGAARCRN